MKPIRLSRHALSYTARRGFSPDEVIDTIRSAKWEQAELGRLECRKNFRFEQYWNGKYYKTKQVRPIFVEEQG
jgi:hypothetical protein